MSILGNWFGKEKAEALEKGLEKSKSTFFERLGKAVLGKSVVDDDVLDNLEEVLVSSDVGVETTLKIIDRIRERVARNKYLGTAELDRILREEVIRLLAEAKADDTGPSAKPHVILIVGVNGVGKTTTIGKLATHYRISGMSVLLGACDTFRAAAVDQLKLWAVRAGVPVVSKEMNTDPSSVAYDTVQQGMHTGVDVVIIDTAGRLHTKTNLMNELSKIKRVIQKVLPGAPHEVLLVLDGSTGQNAAIQAREFTKVTDVTGLIITKLDGTARGGVVIGISDEFKIPVRYIGVGEKAEDLQAFDRQAFVEALFNRGT